MRRFSLSAPAEIVVRVLGSVDILGAARPFERAWTRDLVVYLSLHPQGVCASTWTAALWPDRLVAESTRHSTVSAARRALGRSSDGADHLPRCNGRLAVAPSVSSDWARFVALSKSEGADAPNAWESALDLVRGHPFDGMRAGDWVVLEGLQATVEDAIVQLAVRLAEHKLDEGEPRGAEQALRRGLLAAPYDERLYRLLMCAADAQGNPAGVDSAMDELLRQVGAEDCDPSIRRRWIEASLMRWVHPQTAAVYRSLSRGVTGAHWAAASG